MNRTSAQRKQTPTKSSYFTPWSTFTLPPRFPPGVPVPTAAMSLTSVEQAIYKRIKAQSSLILGDPELRQQLTGTPVEEIAQGVNGLSRKGLILIKKAGNRILYQAVSKDEAKRTGTFEHDEGLVYSHIKDAGNMGAWTRPLKMATNLHQTSFNKAIKGLESKMAIKLVKSVKVSPERARRARPRAPNDRRRKGGREETRGNRGSDDASNYGIGLA